MSLEDIYRRCLETVAPAENKAMRKNCGGYGYFISTEDASKRGSLGGRPKLIKTKDKKGETK
jgi:hypothetical protein